VTGDTWDEGPQAVIGLRFVTPPDLAEAADPVGVCTVTAIRQGEVYYRDSTDSLYRTPIGRFGAVCARVVS
jgi:hypothetical protein